MMSVLELPQLPGGGRQYKNVIASRLVRSCHENA
jgi:hypothetical protein